MKRNQTGHPLLRFVLWASVVLAFKMQTDLFKDFTSPHGILDDKSPLQTNLV